MKHLLFGPQIDLKSLAIVCRSLGTMLNSGVSLQKALQLAAGKSGDARSREALDAVHAAVGRGDAVADALRGCGGAFPELVIDMVEVGEQTGSLPEVLVSLAGHYDNLLRLRKDFVLSIAWPTFQFTVAVLVIAVVIVILGWIADTRGGEPMDVTGFNLRGPAGALVWLTMTFGTVAGLFVAYQVAVRSLGGRLFLHATLLRVPVVGDCLRSFAIARFSWAFALTQEAGMSIGPSLEASLRATRNGAFIAAFPQLWSRVREGEPLSDALSASRLFPEDYVQMVRVGEESGTVPETLDRLSPQFEDQARRSLQALTATLGWGVWALVAAFIIFLIFNIVLQYLALIDQALG